METVLEKPKHNGMVIWYSPDKGIGFLAVEGYPDDLFVHISELTRSGVDNLAKRQKIKCCVGEDRNGRPCATDIEVLA